MFRSPIVIEPRWGRQRFVTSVREAAEVLLREWPAGDYGKRREAKVACLKALQGAATPGSVRKAFVAAAREARIVPAKPIIAASRAD